MSQDESARYLAGQTALLATMAEAEPLVEHWRRRFDPSAGRRPRPRDGFSSRSSTSISSAPAVIDAPTTLTAGHGPFTVRFERCGRFPDVLCLAPTPDQPLRALTESIAAH